MISAFELRITLLIVALIIIAAIYVWYRANTKDRMVDDLSANDFDLTDELDDIPSLSEVDDALGLPDDLRSEFQGVSKELREETISKRVHDAKTVQQEVVAKSAPAAASVSQADSKQMVVVFHVVAREPDMFTGPMIEQMMTELELEHGEMGVYHYNIQRLDKTQSIYCVANMLKPGTFTLSEMATFKSPGLTFILQLPGPEDELKSFNIMTEHAQRLATFLNGDLLDGNHNPISKQSITTYKEQVQLFGLRATRQSASA